MGRRVDSNRLAITAIGPDKEKRREAKFGSHAGRMLKYESPS